MDAPVSKNEFHRDVIHFYFQVIHSIDVLHWDDVLFGYFFPSVCLNRGYGRICPFSSSWSVAAGCLSEQQQATQDKTSAFLMIFHPSLVLSTLPFSFVSICVKSALLSPIILQADSKKLVLDCLANPIASGRLMYSNSP